MLWLTALYFFAFFLTLVAIGMLVAQPDGRPIRFLRDFFLLNAVMIGVAYMDRVTAVGGEGFPVERLTGWLCLINSVLFTRFISAIGDTLEKSSPGTVLFVRWTVIAVTAGAIGYAICSVWMWHAGDIHLSHRWEYAFHSISAFGWMANVGLLVGLIRRLQPQEEAEKSSLQFLLTGTLMVIGIGIVLSMNTLITGTVADMNRLVPLADVLFVPLAAAAIHRYDFFTVDVRQSVRQVFEEAKDGIALLNPAGCVVQLNCAAEEMMGTRPGEAIGQPLESLPVAQDPEHLLRRFPVRRGRRMIGELVVMRDLRDERRAQEVLKRSAARLEEEIQDRMDELVQLEEMEAIGTYAGSIAHDFNNLLASIQGFSAAALQDLPQGEAASEEIERILSVVRRARVIVDQLLLFSRPPGGRREPVRIGRLLESSLPLVKSSFSIPVTVSLLLPPEDVQVMGRPGDLAHAFMNLCANACRAMVPAGQGDMEIRVSTVPSLCDAHYQGKPVDPTRLVEIVVRDSGEGMTDEIRSLACEPYFTTREDAVGLGLPVALRIAIEHQGGLFLRPAPVHGSEAGLVLPRMDVVEAGPSGTAQAAIIGGEHLLLVDDDVRLLDLEKIGRAHV